MTLQASGKLQAVKRASEEYKPGRDIVIAIDPGHGGHDPGDPRLSPVRADFTGAPPTLIQCAKGELLEGDSAAIAARLREAGADVTFERWSGVPHVWHFMAGSAPVADRAIARMADFAQALP